MSSILDLGDFISSVSYNNGLFPHVNTALSVSKNLKIASRGGLLSGLVADILADFLKPVAESSIAFHIDVNSSEESTSQSIHSSRFSFDGLVSSVDLFCVVNSLQFEASVMDALKAMKKVASSNAMLVLLLTDYDSVDDPVFADDVWLFKQDDFVNIFGSALISVEKFGDSWLVLTNVPNEFNDACVFNVNAQESIPISTNYRDPFFTSHQLDDIGIECATDKSSRFHNYLLNYEFFLSRFKQESFTLMELGVLCGSSVKMWSRYFPNAKIVGVDIEPECLKYQTDNIHIEIADLRNVESVIKLRDFNASIIIDDASHSWKDQILAISVLFSSLPHGGVYIVEDLETSFLSLSRRFSNFRPYFDFNIDAFSFIEYINRVIVGGARINELTDTSFLDRLSIEGMKLSDVVNLIGSSASFAAMMHGSAVFVKR